MVRGKKDGLLIAGGGLAGSLAAIALARLRPEIPLLLVEEAESFGGGDRLWTIFDEHLEEEGRALLAPIVSARWPGYYAAFPGQSRKLKAGLAAIRSADIDRLVRETLRPDQYRLGTKAVAVREDELVLLGGERIKADGAVDARGAANLSMLELGWRKLLARDYRFTEPHQVDRPVMVDATVDQHDGLRFARCFPFSDVDMRVEESYLSEKSEFDPGVVADRLDAYVARRRWRATEVGREEIAALPIPIGGDFGAFWRVGGARVAKIGMRGGFFHPATGSPLGDAVHTALLFARQRDFSGAALHDAFETEANALWKKREIYRSFNAALFRSGQDRRQMLDEIYRLDPALIARFHTARLGMLDRIKLGKLVR